LLDDSFLKFLPAPLREPRRAWLAILLGWVLSIAGSLALASLSQWIAPNQPKLDIPNLPAWMLMFSFVIFAPVVETLIMAGFLSLFLRFMPPAWAILLSVVGWAAAHSVQVAGWGLVIWWPFLIFSTLFVVWRQRSWWAGVGVAATTHMLQNLGPGLALAFRTAI
jgi:hypothetical protein